jgi:LysM repeat protein
MRTRMLFSVGLVLLIVALGGLVLLSTRSFPRETLVSSVSGEALLPPTAISSLTPTPIPTPTTPSETPSAPIYHTVRYGETLFTIARLYGVNPYAIARANGIPNPNYIYAGQVLLIPQGGETTPLPPKAVISGPTSGSVGETLSFSGANSTDPDGRIVSYAWNFGDGTTGSGVNVTHSYKAAGSYKVTLTVTDDGGLSDSATLKIQEPTEIIEAEWPKKMEIDRSDSIRVSLLRTTDQVFVPTIEIAGHTVIAASPIPIGTLEAPIEEAFGSEYKASAIAKLAGAAFKISPLTTEHQSLEQPEIKWVWNIMPEKPDLQTINVSIQVKWEPIGRDGETIQLQIWDSQLYIFVDKPLIATGQLNVFSLVSLFVGSTLSVPWLYEKIKERIEKRQKDKESKPKIYLP